MLFDFLQSYSNVPQQQLQDCFMFPSSACNLNVPCCLSTGFKGRIDSRNTRGFIHSISPMGFRSGTGRPHRTSQLLVQTPPTQIKRTEKALIRSEQPLSMGRVVSTR